MMDIKKLKKAHFAAAKIVEKLGDDYLIFFERIHRELIDAENKQGLKHLALRVAVGHSEVSN